MGISPTAECSLGVVNRAEAASIREMLGVYSPDYEGLSPSEYVRKTDLEVTTPNGKIGVGHTLGGENGGQMLLNIPNTGGANGPNATAVKLNDNGNIISIEYHYGAGGPNYFLDGLTVKASEFAGVVSKAREVIKQVSESSSENIRQAPPRG